MLRHWPILLCPLLSMCVTTARPMECPVHLPSLPVNRTDSLNAYIIEVEGVFQACGLYKA